MKKSTIVMVFAVLTIFVLGVVPKSSVADSNTWTYSSLGVEVTVSPEAPDKIVIEYERDTGKKDKNGKKIIIKKIKKIKNPGCKAFAWEPEDGYKLTFKCENNGKLTPYVQGPKHTRPHRMWPKNGGFEAEPVTAIANL
tara:strand:+ start:6184 stop:6600 length:417 start_codon:yes stop_codon:yes gene_type:complete